MRLGAATRVRRTGAHRGDGAVAAAVDGDLEVAVQPVAGIVRGTRVGQLAGAGRDVNGSSSDGGSGAGGSVRCCWCGALLDAAFCCEKIDWT